MARREIGIKKRGTSKRKLKPVYLIIAEGKNKTEVLYLSHFQDQEKNYSIRFVKAGHKTDADSLYNALVDKWEELDLSEKKGDRGFVILDIDNDPLKAQKVLALAQSNTNTAVSFVVSNPTFEVWFLLHFKYTTKQYKDGNAVIKELRRYLPNYEKNRDCFEDCKDETKEAVKNSIMLAEYYADCEWPSIECNPRTDVGVLIACLEGEEEIRHY
ncbi:MAG: RloB domain-containing protein [Lachnospiraceae bacterium]|nr:RloB domain-containing protein [Lachnospiraceae bacterium]